MTCYVEDIPVAMETHFWLNFKFSGNLDKHFDLSVISGNITCNYGNRFVVLCNVITKYPDSFGHLHVH